MLVISRLFVNGGPTGFCASLARWKLAPIFSNFQFLEYIYLFMLQCTRTVVVLALAATRSFVI